MPLSEATKAKMVAAGFDPNVERYSPEYQRWVRSCVSHQACVENGKKGFAALKAAGKEDLAKEFAANWRFEHPSDLEQIIIGIMRQYNMPVDRQHREVKVGKYYVDFKYGDYVLEVNDDTWHTNDFHGDDRVGHDQGKYAYLREQGLTVVILAEKVVRGNEIFDLMEDLITTLYRAMQQEF